MDELGKALIELIKTGTPLASEAIRWYYITYIVGYVTWLLSFAGFLGFGVWLAKLIHDFGERRANQEYALRMERKF